MSAGEACPVHWSTAGSVVDFEGYVYIWLERTQEGKTIKTDAAKAIIYEETLGWMV